MRCRIAAEKQWGVMDVTNGLSVGSRSAEENEDGGLSRGGREGGVRAVQEFPGGD